MTHSLRKVLVGLAILALGASEALAASADRAYIGVRPTTGIVRATTNFDPALRCMDDLLGRNGYGSGVKLLANQLQDPKNEVGGVTRDMIVSAAARMSEKSRFFDVLPGANETTFNEFPDLMIVRGSITQYDKAVEGKGIGGGIGIGASGVGGRKQQTTAVMAVTLYLTSAKGLVKPGTLQNVAIVLRQSSKGGDLTGSIGLFGGFFELEFSQAEGAHQALRSLIDLAMIQAVGGYAQVPYQRCLAQVAVDPATTTAWRKTWDGMNPRQQSAAIGDMLVTRALLTPEAAKNPEALRTALASYQLQQGIPAMGAANFETYLALGLAKDVAATASNTPMGTAFGIKVAPYGPGFLSFNNSHSLPMGNRASVAVTVAKTANVVCYYTDTKNRSTRIFPNAQRPGYRLQAGETLILPGPEDIYTIESDQVGAETVTCLAGADSFLTRLPAPLQAQFGSEGPLAVADARSLLAAIRASAPDLSFDAMTYDVCSRC